MRRKDMIRRKRGGGAAFVVVSLAVAACMGARTGARAETQPKPPPPSLEQGLTLAQKFCSGCHVIGDSADAIVPAGVPTFRAIANRPEQTAQRLMNVLIQPHPPMPQMQLTTQEMKSIILYLETLRTDKSAPPLLPPGGEDDKPLYPEPS